jgi:uncharacterized protein Usg
VAAVVWAAWTFRSHFTCYQMRKGPVEAPGLFAFRDVTNPNSRARLAAVTLWECQANRVSELSHGHCGRRYSIVILKCRWGPTMSEAKSFYRQLRGYSLATASILYRMPDHPAILQSYIWQEYDIAPRFPELRRFLDFWTRTLNGPLHSVTVAHAVLFKPAEIQFSKGEWQLH